MFYVIAAKIYTGTKKLGIKINISNKLRIIKANSYDKFMTFFVKERNENSI